MGSTHQGRKYLEMVDLGAMADKEIKTSKGSIKAEDFLEACGSHALAAFKGFEAMDPSHPSYELAKKALRDMALGYING